MGGVWLVVGLFVDGYAHAEVIETETEDFFTPWHAVFYSGFAFSAAAIGIGITATWATWMLLAHLTATVRWPPELWAGQILMCGFLALAMALAVFPQRCPKPRQWPSKTRLGPIASCP